MFPSVQGICAQLGCAYGWTRAIVNGSLMSQVLSNAMHGEYHLWLVTCWFVLRLSNQALLSKLQKATSHNHVMHVL